jgi:hypothetical protein
MVGSVDQLTSELANEVRASHAAPAEANPLRFMRPRRILGPKGKPAEMLFNRAQGGKRPREEKMIANLGSNPTSLIERSNQGPGGNKPCIRIKRARVYCPHSQRIKWVVLKDH